MEYGYYQSELTSANERKYAKFMPSGITTMALGLLVAVTMPGKIGPANPLPAASDLTAELENVPEQEADIAPVIAESKTSLARDQRTNVPIPTPSIKPKRHVQMASLEVKIPKYNQQPFASPKNARLAPFTIPKHLDKKLFGSAEFRFDDERKIKAWSGVYQRFVQDTGSLRRCVNNSAQCNDPIIEKWAAGLRPLKGQSRQAVISQINARANQISYVSDRNIYGRSDYWASPREFLKGAGDCEDFALLKFASLLALGFDNRDIRLVVGTLPDGTPHAFLTVKIGADEIVMDNRNNQVFVSNNRADYVPKYSVNLTDRWSHFIPQSRTT